MYDEVLTTSGRHAKSNRAYMESVINEYEENSKPVKESTVRGSFESERDMVMENMMQRDCTSTRYQSFAQTVRNALVTEALYKIFSESVDQEVRDDHVSSSIMRAMVSQYVTENGYDNILNRMKTASVTTSCIYKTITETSDKILKGVDKTDPNTFTITPEMRDEFFKSLDYSDSEAISDAIHQRVVDAMEDFVTANTKDHEDITAALKQAQEKIGTVSEEDTELRECYEMAAKRTATEVRNRPKSVLHSMVTATCESVMRHKEMQDEFMIEGHLDVDKIVSRTKLMYTFMEMLNTSRIDKVDASFIEGVIADLSK